MSYKDTAIHGSLGWENRFYFEGWRRCSLCGKLLEGPWPCGVDIYDEDRYHRGAYTICLDHGGKDGKIYTDTCTNIQVTVPPMPRRADKLLADAKQEFRHWAGMLARYYWWRARLPVQDIFYATIHPMTYWRWRRGR